MTRRKYEGGRAEAARLRWQNPEFREKMRAAQSASGQRRREEVAALGRSRKGASRPDLAERNRQRAGLPNLKARGPRKDEVGYVQAHDRLLAIMPAECAHCGRKRGRGYRMDFALQHDTPEEDVRQSPDGRRYSMNPDHYITLCRQCHARYDKFGFQPGHPYLPRKEVV